MPNQKFKYLNSYPDRHGIERIYFRRGKGEQNIPLRGPVGSIEFLEDYMAAHKGMPTFLQKQLKTPQRVINQEKNPKSFAWLYEQYKKSDSFIQLSNRTKYVRSGILDKFCTVHGDKPFALLERKHLLKIRDEIAHTPAAANNLIKCIRQVFNFAVDRELIDNNPARDIKSIKMKGGGIHAWTEQEVLQFEARHPVGSMARLSLALGLYTCQRKADLAQMGKHMVHNGILIFRQYKNRDKKPVDMQVPIVKPLQDIIDATEIGEETFIVSDHGRPYTIESFGNRMRKWCDQAGLPQCSAHGLRKVGAARLAEAGCSDLEIMAMGGWSTLKEVERYTRSVRRRMMAENAVKKMNKKNS